MRQQSYHPKLGVPLGSTWVLLSAAITAPQWDQATLSLKHSWVSVISRHMMDGPIVQKDLQIWKVGREYGLFAGSP